ncbi:Retina-specific copper amine oxidase [Frankliniella fusca]|uniref:Retina-specific copper amine oxidase n=1 Tax=Frankliniella fusca TaxID=407009 RepID=A0AAE1HYA6_9NEOP|nr:Retina-specific copper amine oxidase [Frankliniella fusca]
MAQAWLFIVRTASYFGCHISAHSRPPEKPIQMSQCFGNTKMIHLTQLSFLPLCHRDIPVEDHSGTLPGSCLYDRKPSLASGAGGCFPVGPDHIQVQAGTTLICGWLPASLGKSSRSWNSCSSCLASPLPNFPSWLTAWTMGKSSGLSRMEPRDILASFFSLKHPHSLMWGLQGELEVKPPLQLVHSAVQGGWRGIGFPMPG